MCKKLTQAGGFYKQFNYAECVKADSHAHFNTIKYGLKAAVGHCQIKLICYGWLQFWWVLKIGVWLFAEQYKDL